MIAALLRHAHAGHAAMLRDIRAEIELLRRERDAARAALRVAEGEVIAGEGRGTGEERP